MKFLPLEDITYKTKLTESEVIEHLTQALEPKKPFRFSEIFSNNITKPYQGKIFDNKFSITRIIDYRNSFLPVITGTIKPTSHETTIEVKMRLHDFVTVFLYIWCSIVGSTFFGFLSYCITHKALDPFLLIPFGMLVFIYVLTMGAFKSEAKRSKKDLQKMFEARIVDVQK